MKKYLMIGFAAIAFASCSNHDFETMTQEQIVKAEYDAKFVAHFGNPASNQDWGLSKFKTSTRAAAPAFTRVSTKSGDVYDKFPSAGDVAAYFPTSIPTDAKTDEEIEAEWKGKNAVDEDGNEIIADWGEPIPMWDLYAIYLNMVGKVINNIKVTTPGEFVVGHSWANPADRVYNVYINVGDGNSLTLKRNGAEHVNFYIMSGNVTIDSNFGECGGIISVAEGATVNDERTHIAHNDGVKVFNKGTYNATNTTPYWNGKENTSVFDIGNFCTFYNEGTFNCSGGMSYSPGDANDSYFINMGDEAVLTAASMTLNSTGNFFNSGKTIITGETNVTQSDIYWVNDGFYETGTMVFSAKNCTFYNYCNLIVSGNAHMYDGEFNLMDNSYTEAGSAEMDNFIVNMGSNTGMNIKGNLSLPIGQADGTYQGFRTTGSNDFLRVEGTVTVAEHMYTLQLTGDITYAFGALVDLGKDNSGVQPTYVFNEGTTECALADLTVTPNTASCGATWKKKVEEIEYVGRVMAEDLTASVDVTGTKSDWDFNDVVFDWAIKDKKAYIKLLAAGGTLQLRIGGTRDDATSEPDGSIEIHSAVGLGAYMCNTGEKTVPAKEIVLDDHEYESVDDILLTVYKGGSWVEITAITGDPAAKFYCDTKTKWCDEYVDIKIAYPKFAEWVRTPSVKWEEEVESKLVDLNLKNNAEVLAE